MVKLIRKVSVFVIAVFLVILPLACSKQTKKEEPYDPERYLKRADELINNKDYEEARKLLFELKNRDQTKRYAPIAQLKIADSYVRDGDYDAGIEEYRKFIEHYPDNQYASYAQYQIAMAYFNQIEAPDRGAGAAKKALAEFERLKQLYPRNPFREVIDIRIEKARDTIAESEFLVGLFYYKKGSYNAALGRFQGLLRQFPEYKRADETLYLIGMSYKGLKDREKAVEAFKGLIDRFPNSPFSQKAKKEL